MVVVAGPAKFGKNAVARVKFREGGRKIDRTPNTMYVSWGLLNKLEDKK